MKQALIIFLAICAFVTAFVPREKRALNTEEEEHSTKGTSSSASNSTPQEICAEFTPCAWTMYQPISKMIQGTMNSSYCSCATGQDCVIDYDDTSVYTYVHRCRPPQANQPENS